MKTDRSAPRLQASGFRLQQDGKPDLLKPEAWSLLPCWRANDGVGA